MSNRRKIAYGFISAGIFAAAAISIGIHQHYYREYRDFAKAIRAAGYTIEMKWLYDEDFVLEDFGIFVTKSDIQFWIDIRYLSDIRHPEAPIEGIILQSIHEGWDAYERVFDTDSPFWSQSGLYKIKTPIEFLDHAHEILPTLIDSKTQFPASKRIYSSEKFRNYLIIRDDPSDVAPVTSTFLHKAS